MSNVQVNTADVQAYKDQLQELIDGDKGRKETRKGDGKAFVDAWVSLASITGVTSEVVDYLFNGQRMVEAEPLYQLARQGDAVKTYGSFMKTIRSSKNENGCTLRMLLNLLALELLEPTSPDSLDSIAVKLPATSKNKKGKQFGNLTSLTRKLLIHPMVGKTINTSADISIISAKTLIRLLRNPLEKISKAHNARAADVVVVSSLLKWLEERAYDTPEVEPPAEDASTPEQASPVAELSPTVEDEEDQTVPSESNEKPKPEGRPSVKAAEECISSSKSVEATGSEIGKSDSATATPEEENSDSKPETKDTRKSKAVDTIAKDKASPHKKDSEDLKAKLEKAKVAKKEAEEQLDNALTLLRQAKHELDDMNEQRASLSRNYANLRHRFDAVEAENASLREDLAAAEGMMTMLEERDAHKENVADQKMIRDLKFEYEDFRDALDLDMTVDLGENMRDQLSNVFDILISNGIDLL